MKYRVFILAVITAFVMLSFSCKAENPTIPTDPAEGNYTGGAYSLVVWAQPHMIAVDGYSSSNITAQLKNQLGNGVPGKTMLFQLFYNGRSDIFDPVSNNDPVNYTRDSQRNLYGHLTDQTSVSDPGGVARTIYYSPADPMRSLFVKGPDGYGGSENVPTGATRYMVAKATVSVDLDVRQITLHNWFPVMLYWPY